MGEVCVRARSWKTAVARNPPSANVRADIVFRSAHTRSRSGLPSVLMGPSVVRRQSVRRGGETCRYELDPPRRYYQCYGMRAPYRLRCREHPVIRAERLEELVWGEVRRVLEHPGP